MMIWSGSRVRAASMLWQMRGSSAAGCNACMMIRNMESPSLDLLAGLASVQTGHTVGRSDTMSLGYSAAKMIMAACFPLFDCALY